MNKQSTLLCAAISLISITGVMRADIAVSAAPVGITTKKVAPGASGLAFPLIRADVFVGLAASNTDNTITVTRTAADIRSLLEVDRPYYAEIVNGPLEGERLDLDTSATIGGDGSSLVLLLGGDTHSTLNALPTNALVGARVIVRPFPRLSDITSMLFPKLVGSDKANLADGLNIFEGGAYAFYFLRANGVGWGRKDTAGDFSDLVIPPDDSVQLVLRSGSKSFVTAGIVRTSAFRKNLTGGWQSFSTGFPIALSPFDLGAFTDPNAASGTDWQGSTDPDLADQLQVGIQKPVAFQRYFLDGGGRSWRQVAGKIDVNDTPIAGETDSIILKRNNPDAGYLILLPFNP